MMGTKIRTFSPLESVSLEELVPKDNFYRRLKATIDFSFVRELVRDCYASSGRPSVDPVVFFRLQLVMFFEDIHSERQLMEVAADRLSIRWFLGYDLHEPLPDHSSLIRIRERYGLEIFRRFFERIVEMCIDAGLIWGKELYFDATKVEANASVPSMGPRLVVVKDLLEEHLADIFPEKAHPIQGANVPESAVVVGPTGQEWQALAEANAHQHRWIEQTGRKQREVVRWGYRRLADLRVSATDPDTSPMHYKKKGAARLGYLTHYVVDGGKARVILGAAEEARGPALVVVGRRGLGVVDRLRLGSVSTAVLRSASGPVLIVPDPRAQACAAGKPGHEGCQGPRTSGYGTPVARNLGSSLRHRILPWAATSVPVQTPMIPANLPDTQSRN
jgi:transposase